MKNEFQFMMCRRKQMKKTLILALVAAFALTGSAFARTTHGAENNATFSFGVGGAAAGPSTTNNDDSCDISTAPAATLLLPYFEVETSTRGVDTFFTITNTGYLPQIAHVSLWTDWSFPVLDFNIFLTGYDVQSISLYDVIVNGIVAPTNPNLNTANCVAGLLPGIIGQTLRTAIQSALVTGIYNAPGFGANGCGSTAV